MNCLFLALEKVEIMDLIINENTLLFINEILNISLNEIAVGSCTF